MSLACRRSRQHWLAGMLVMLFGVALNACAANNDEAMPLMARVLPTQLRPTAAVTATPFFYEVQAGDNLWLIAERFGLDVEILTQVNELENPDLLQPGQQLLISDRVTVSGRILPTRTPTPLPCLEGCRRQLSGCEIKAVIARLDGSHLYLLPGDSFYDRLPADLWFCREEDAEKAGWLRWTDYGPAVGR